MDEEYVWMCLFHNEVFRSEDAVRNHEDKMECVAVLIPRAEAEWAQIVIQKSIIGFGG